MTRESKLKENKNMNKNKNSMLEPYLYCGNIQVDNYENVYLYKIYEREKIIQNCSNLQKNICLLEGYIKNTKKERIFMGPKFKILLLLKMVDMITSIRLLHLFFQNNIQVS